MKSALWKAVLLFVAISAFKPAFAQVATGLQPYGSFAGGPDVLNLGNLNAYLTIPIRHKAGRGQDFDYNLLYNSTVYSPVKSNGSWQWQPVSGWGWQGLSTGGMVYEGYAENYSSSTCGYDNKETAQVWTYSNFVYVDEHGTRHTFAGDVGGQYIVSNGVPPSCPQSGANPSGVLTSPAGDGSGLSVQFYTDQNGFHATIYTSTGQVVSAPVMVNYTPPTGTLTSTDRNGNEITSTSTGAFTDTLGVQALLILGSAPSNTTLQYNDPQGNLVGYTVSYVPYNIKTNFGCTGTNAPGEYSASSVYLVDKITLPDQRYYKFQYETTPSFSGYYTGRVTSISLPGGGSISYQYTGSNNGIECSDGSTAGLIRTVSDGTTSNSWTYTRSVSNSVWTTRETAPSYNGVSNDTVHTFLNGYAFPTFFYEIKKQTYSGSYSSGTLLQTVLHCYSAGSCDPVAGETGTTVNGTQVSQNMTSVQSPDYHGITRGTLDGFDSAGNLISHLVYDYGTSGTGVYSTNPIQTTTYSYWVNGALESSFPSEVTLKDGGGSTLSDTKYGYDETTAVSTSGTPQHTTPPSGSRGNLTSVKRWVSGTTWQTATFTNYDTGNIQTANDVNGEVTTYTYGSTTSCGNSFPTAVSSTTGVSRVPTLGTSATWHCDGGVLDTSWDLNTNSTTYTYGSDPYWRPTSITNNATTATVNFSYPLPSSNSSSSVLNFNVVNSSPASTSTSVTTYDGLGRPILQQTRQGPGSSTYDSVATAYDSIGRIASTTLPYSGALGSYVPANSGSAVTYDALGRTSTVSDSGGGTKQYSYSSNDVLVTVGPQVTLPSTENLKKRNLEYNGAGWLTSVCEVVTSTAPAGGACGQTTGYTGYLTKYSYDGAGRLTQSQQNAQAGSSGLQTRMVGYDGLNRKTSESIPEWSDGTQTAGTATYTYDTDSSSNCTGTYTGDLIKAVDNVGNVTCYTYDLLHRKLTSKVASGHYASATPAAYYIYDAESYGSTAMQNAAGNLAEAYTCPGTGSCTQSTKITDEFFSASPVTTGAMAGGVMLQMWEYTQDAGHYFMTSDTYYPNGALGAVYSTFAGGSYGIPTHLSFGVDGEGRPNYATDVTHNLVSNVTYNPGNLVNTITYGNSGSGLGSDFDQFTYDSNTDRPTNLTYSVSPSSGTYTVTTALTWNANGSLQQMVYTDGNQSSMNQNCKYTADDLSRIASVDCGSSAWGQNFSYDPFGNIQKTVPGQRTGTTYSTGGYSTVTNQVLNSGVATYDKNGNQLTSTPATLTWNAWNVPVSVNSSSATYDALGRMVETVNGTTYKEFVFRPSGDVLAVYESAGPNPGLVKGTIPLPGGSAAVYGLSGLSYIRHKDWLGSSRLATTWAHAVYSKVAYAPFGETYNESGSTPDRSFTGKDQNVATASGGGGAYDFLFRKYDPSAGRWLSPDPSGWNATGLSDPQSLNRYAYVENGPLQAIDPDGLSCLQNDIYDSNGNIVSSVWVDDGDGQGCPAAGVAPSSPANPEGTNDGTVSAWVGADNGPCGNDSNCVVVTAPSPDCGYGCQVQAQNAINQLLLSGRQVLVLVNAGPSGAPTNRNGTPNSNIVPGTECNRGCHKEPFTPHWDKQHTCPELWVVGGTSVAMVPGGAYLDLSAQWFLWGSGAGAFIGSAPCL